MSYLYRVTVNKLSTRALIARTQLEAIRPGAVGPEGDATPHPQDLASLACQRNNAVLHVLLEAPSLAEIEKAVASDLGDLDAIEGFVAELDLLGDCLIWPAPAPKA